MSDYLSELPLEILSKIVAQLSLADVERNLFTCKYLFNAITSSPFPEGIALGRALVQHTYSNGTKSTSLLLPRVVEDDVHKVLLTTSYGTFLNILTDQGYFAIERVYIHLERDKSYDDLVHSLLNSFKIRTLHLDGLNSASTPPKIENAPFKFLKHFILNFSEEIDTDYLNGLAVSAPNLECLEIRNVKLPDSDHSQIVFNRLTSVAITSAQDSNFRTARSGRIILKRVGHFLTRVPNLSRLKLTGLLWLEDYSTTDFFKPLTNLEYFEYKPPAFQQYIDIIIPGRKLTQLSLGSIITDTKQTIPLTQIEAFTCHGPSCEMLLDIYGIGDSLKILSIRNPGDRLTSYPDSLWQRCPNLEQLIVLRATIHLKKLIGIKMDYCKKLSLICFDQILLDDENDYKLIPKGIKNIYLGRLLPHEITWLVDNGFNVYVGEHKYGTMALGD